jgi:transcriptional regulator with XRE-family HTH domain
LIFVRTYCLETMLPENLKFLREQKAWTIAKTADNLDISPERYSNYERGLRQPDIDMLIKLSSFWKLSIDILIKADLSKTDISTLLAVGSNRLLMPILVDKDRNDTIEVIPVKSHAGYAKGYSDPQFFDKLPIMKLPFRITGKHRAFPIKGDSMPPVKEGSFVVGKFVESANEIENGNTYVVLTANEGLVYKRVYKKGSVLELHSDNKSYQPYQVKLEDVLELWKFVCCINLSDQKEEEINMQSLMDMLKSMKVEMEGLRV